LLLAACAGRRGWLFCLPLLLALPQPSQAFEFNDLWLRPDQQGQRLLEQSRPASAARHFQNPQWRGMALYQAGDYAGAAQAFSQGNTAADHYNRGNALARSGELEAALDAYEQALERQPDLQPALDNQALVQQLLQQREAKAEEQPASNEAQGTPGSETEGNSSSASSPAQGTPGNDEPANAEEPGEGSTNSQATPGNQGGADDNVTVPPQRPVSTNLDAEQRQALEQWLREIPDNPAELLRRKFWYEQQLHQETPR
jgi:Ca-activated chloride channel family protein